MKPHDCNDTSSPQHRPMRILGIETTCDETSCAIVDDGYHIRSNIISSQIPTHSQFGGVVPELASRKHIEVIDTILHQALDVSQCTLEDIDLIAVAKGPGLIGALLVGLQFAKGLAFSRNIPLIGINHIEAHLYAAMMTCPDINAHLPALGLVLSGGHTSMVLINHIGNYQLLAETADDAIGEAFDKVARMLELPYPGGPQIEKIALHGNPQAFAFRISCVKNRPLDFSFSGMKTKVLYTIQQLQTKQELLSQQQKNDLAASFQDTAFRDIAEKTQLAISKYPVKALFLGGGVTQNMRLRTMLQSHITDSHHLPIFWPKNDLCSDNAAMLAGLAYHLYQQKPCTEVFTLYPETRIYIN